MGQVCHRPPERPHDAGEFQRRYHEAGRARMRFRTKAQVPTFFDGLDLVEPGLVQADPWRPGVPPADLPTSTNPTYCGVGRKP